MIILFALLFLGGFSFLRWPLGYLMGAAEALLRVFV